jgi:chloride channel 3/4/5
MNFIWSKTFRKYSIIKNHPVFEVFLVTLATALLQYPNPMTREPGDVIIKEMLVDCKKIQNSYTCQNETGDETRWAYIGWLVYGILAKLVLTIITFGIKVPSGIIIPALDGGAFFGRLLGQAVGGVSPGIFAMVGAAAFLAGVSRMTLSLAVVMFELTGELEYVLPNMIAILIAKWVADALEKEGVYDLAQTVLGHPFLNLEHAVNLVKRENTLVEVLIPPHQTMQEISVDVNKDGCVIRRILETKLEQLKARGLLDAGLVLVRNGMLLGYLPEAELEFSLTELGKDSEPVSKVFLIGDPDEIEAFGEDGIRMDMFVDRTPLTISEKAPMEYLVEMFGKLGLRYICVVEAGSGKLVGVVLKKRLILWIEGLKD